MLRILHIETSFSLNHLYSQCRMLDFDLATRPKVCSENLKPGFWHKTASGKATLILQYVFDTNAKIQFASQTPANGIRCIL